MTEYFKVTLIKSINRRRKEHKACVHGLGLRKIGHSVNVACTSENLGMINKVDYLLKVEEVIKNV